jgi:hypothetical protein
MNIDELLRETAPDQHHLRARTDGLRAGVLARATARPRRQVRRRLRAGLAAAVVATVGVGGVAYATGTVPSLVTSVVDDFGKQAGVAASDRPEMTQIVDLELPDGSRFAAWAGRSDAMWCTSYLDRWDGTAVGSGGTACSDDGTSYDLNSEQIAWAQNLAGTAYYPVLFGDAGDGVAEVRVSGLFSGTGKPVDLTVPVDPTTSAYAVALPGTNQHPWAHLEEERATFRSSGVTLEFLDASGQVLRTADGPLA